MNKVLLIHSFDETTVFLCEIEKFIRQKGFLAFTSIVLEGGMQDVQRIYREINSLPDGGTIIFLGHGASHCIYMPIGSDSNNKQHLLDSDYFHILRNKNFICLSCRSIEFISRNFIDSQNSFMIGFDDLPTHWQDVFAMREVDVNAYAGMTDSVLEHYRSMLVDIFKYSLWDTISQKSNFSFFYYRLRLYINIFILRSQMGKISDNPTLLGNILFELKNGIAMFGTNRKLTLI